MDFGTLITFIVSMFEGLKSLVVTVGTKLTPANPTIGILIELGIILYMLKGKVGGLILISVGILFLYFLGVL